MASNKNIGASQQGPGVDIGASQTSAAAPSVTKRRNKMTLGVGK